MDSIWGKRMTLTLGMILIAVAGILAVTGIVLVSGMGWLIADMRERDELDHLEQRKGAQRNEDD